MSTTVTFRLLPVPNTTYQVNLIYQKTPPLLSDLSGSWPLPDELAPAYSYFMLFMALDYFDDPRAERYRRLATASLLTQATGLDQTDRNMFLGNTLALMAQEDNVSLRTQQGFQARGI